jgi:hypothetical protein
MVHPAFRLVLRAAFGAALLSLAVPAEATLYKWLDQKGNVTYSNLPPPESAEVRELETIEENQVPTAVELRTRQIIEEMARERRGTGLPGAPGTQSPANSRTAASSAEADAGVRYEWVPQAPQPAAGPPLLDTASLRYPPATPITVRDPCLLSPDPRCYQLNAGNYDPYLGYAPARPQVGGPSVGATRNDVAGAVGATIATPETMGASASARLSAAAHSPTPAPRSFRGLPPGTPVLPIGR